MRPRQAAALSATTRAGHRTRTPRWRDGYERGLTCAQIGGELAERAGKLGLATYARTRTPREDRDLRRLSRDGFELERAARLLSRTPEALRAPARKFGIAPRSHLAAGVPAFAGPAPKTSC